jgi:antitoxin MazE
MASTVQKWGNSLGVRIPKAIADQVHLAEGAEFDFDTAGGVLTLRPRRKQSRQSLAKLLAKAKGPSPHGELLSDRPRGRELL